MAEIVLNPDRDFAEQLREIFDVAGSDLHHTVHTFPRPNVPHGQVVSVPDLVAEAHTNWLRGEDGQEGTEDDKPKRGRGSRGGKTTKPAASEGADQTPQE